jgi:hypothetical protein
LQGLVNLLQRLSVGADITSHDSRVSPVTLLNLSSFQYSPDFYVRDRLLAMGILFQLHPTISQLKLIVYPMFYEQPFFIQHVSQFDSLSDALRATIRSTRQGFTFEIACRYSVYSINSNDLSVGADLMYEQLSVHPLDSRIFLRFQTSSF